MVKRDAMENFRIVKPKSLNGLKVNIFFDIDSDYKVTIINFILMSVQDRGRHFDFIQLFSLFYSC